MGVKFKVGDLILGYGICNVQFNTDGDIIDVIPDRNILYIGYIIKEKQKGCVQVVCPKINSKNKSEKLAIPIKVVKRKSEILETFMSQKLEIKCANLERSIDFLNECDKCGIRWGHCRASALNPYTNKLEDTSSQLYFHHVRGYLTYLTDHYDETPVTLIW